MKLTSKIVGWAVCGVVLSALAVPTNAKVRTGILPAGDRPTQPETQLSLSPQAAPAPAKWEMPMDTPKTTSTLPLTAKDAQEAPADSAVAAKAMLAKLKAPDGRTRQGIGWFLGVMGFTGFFGAGNTFGMALIWMGFGLILLLSGRQRHREVQAERKRAEAAGAAPFVEVRGRVGRGVLLLGFILSSTLIVAAATFPVLGIGAAAGAVTLGGIMLAWRKSAFIKAMLANGFGQKWVK